MPAEANGVDRTRDTAERVLLERPSFSIRLQIALGFFLCFLLVFLSNAYLLSTVNKVEKKLYFLEVANHYLFEIQQARRFEKNYFLYGTNLEDALSHIQSAKETLLLNADMLKKVTSTGLFNKKVSDLKHYEKLLNDLKTLGRAGKTAHEEKIREFGAKMVSFAQDLVNKEQNIVQSMLSQIKRTPIYFLILLSVLIVYLAVFLIKRIMGPIGRFLGYTKRIAEGDFSPISPARPYRDEFSNLAIAMNHMLREINRRQQILLESHKLRAVGTLTAGVAHELNNPINNIALTAYSLLDDYYDTSDDEKLEMIQDLVKEADRSNRIVRNLLDFARESESKMEAVDLENIVKETVQLAGNQIRLSQTKLQLNVEPNLPRIHGDRQQLGQVFLNLVINALDAMEEQNHDRTLGIDVSHSKKSNFIAVRVADNGPGIPLHILPNIFDPFFTTKETGKGTGLGLSVSQGIIAKHGGRIDVESSVGGGTTATVLLPVTTIPAEMNKESRRYDGQDLAIESL